MTNGAESVPGGRQWGLTVVRSAGPETVTIHVAGRISQATSGMLEAALAEAIAGGDRRIVVDLEATDYVSSAGLGVFSAASARLAALGGSLVLAGAQPPVTIALRLADLEPGK